MKIRFFRAQSSKTAHPARSPISLTQARHLIGYLIGSVTEIDTSVKPYISRNIYTVDHGLRNRPFRKTLRDLSSLIKYTGTNFVNPFWISTSLDENCKGQARGRPIWTFELDLTPYKVASSCLIALGSLEKAILSTQPHLLLDNKLQMAKTIVLLHAQSGGECEVSFLTEIPVQLKPKIPTRDGRVSLARSRR